MKEYDRAKIEKEIEKQLNEFKKNKKPTILLMGQTGAGKTSAALEYIFNDPRAKVGVGSKPCTQGITLFPGENINVYDSEGYEINKEEHYRNLIIDGFLKDPSKQGEDGIQAVWYFISGAGKRILPFDKSLIKEVQSMKYKLALIISKIDELSEEQLTDLKKAAQDVNVPIFQISTDEEIKDNEQLTDWNKIAKWTYDILPEIFRDRYIISLNKELAIKRKMVNEMIKNAALLAGGVGGAPMPWADGPVLLGIQGLMIYKILAAYNMNVSMGTMTTMLGTLGVSQAGRWICGQLLKLCPALGNVANAAVAATITFAIGKGIADLCEMQTAQMLAGKPVTIDLESILSSTKFIDDIMEQVDIHKDNIFDFLKNWVK